jgi:hypothetical protein
MTHISPTNRDRWSVVTDSISLGPVSEAATPQERREIYRLVLEVVYVDVLEKRLVEVVPKGAFAPLFAPCSEGAPPTGMAWSVVDLAPEG